MKHLSLRVPILIVLLFFTMNGLRAQANASDIVNKFFDIYPKDHMQAIDMAFATNPWLERNKDAVDGLKGKLKDLLPLIGSYRGFDKLSEKNAGPNLKQMVFAVRYDREALRFKFTLYKAADKWQVDNFSFDEEFESEFK